MNIDELKVALKISHESGIPIFIWGNQGVGKSSGVRQYVNNSYHFENNTIPFKLVDLRCSQMEASEIRGLPDKDIENQRVVYYAPNELPSGEWINRKGNITGKPGSENPGKHNGKEDEWVLHRGVLLIDEVNRAQDDVLQAIFQLVYDRKIGDYVLPTGWMVTAAGNPNSSQFIVNSFVEDAAFKDRFCHIWIDIDEKYNQSWINYMMNLDINSNILTHITQFGLLNPDHLNQNIDKENFVITPSSRSWEFVAKIEQTILNINEYIDSEILQVIRLEMLQGLIGDLANHFLETTIDIMPIDVIKNGLSNNQINIIQQMERSQIQALVWGVANHAKKLNTDNSKREMQNVVRFGKHILEQTGNNRDLAVAFFDIILEVEQQSDIRRLSFSNKSISKLLIKINKNTPWYTIIMEDEDLAELLHKSHRGKLSE